MCDLQVAQQGPGGSVSREQFQQLVDHLEVGMRLPNQNQANHRTC